MNIVVASVSALSGLGVAMGLSLAYASAKFAIKVDPLIGKVREALPGSNCGACGFKGCNDYAEAVATHGAKTNLCVPGGTKSAQEVAAIMGVEPEAARMLTARVLCQGGRSQAARKFTYQGVASCHAVKLLAGGDKTCPYGCFGLGSCTLVCPFDALHMNANGLPEVDLKKCNGCGLCVMECPRRIITVTDTAHTVDIRCRSLDKGGAVKKYCQVGCIGCSKCELICPFEAIEMKDNLARSLYAKCTSCGLCVAECPQKTITKRC